MNRETQNVVLLLVGGAVLKAALDGSYVRYVQPGMRLLLVAAGVLTVLLALLAMVRDIRQAGHSHEEGGGSVYWALLIPAAVMLFVVPPALGANSVGASAQQPMAEPAVRTNFGPLPPGEAPPLSLVELRRRASSGDTVDNRTVTLTGYAMEHDDTKPQAGWDLARVVITCCAADAATVRVRLDTPPPAVARGQWYQARVRLIPGTATPEADYTPTVRLESADPIAPPAEPYEQ